MAYMTLPIYNIDSPVGERQPNLPEDVRLVQQLMNAVARTDGGWAPPAALPADGKYSDNLKAWILAFQTRCARRNPSFRYVLDGKLNPIRMHGAQDWDPSFGGRTVAALYTLNYRSWEGDRQAHLRLGMLMNLRDGKAA